MPNNPVRASGEAMPAINRRRMLTAIVTVPACGMVAGVHAAAAAAHDPLVEAINAYRIGKQAFADLPNSLFTSMEAEDRLVAETYGPAQDLFLRDAAHAPKATSLAGVREAIRLAFEEGALVDCMAETALRSALAYLDGGAA